MMMRNDLATADIAALVREYRLAAREHGDATESGEHRRANESGQLIGEIYAELRRRGVDAQRSLLPLLNDDAPGVRLWAASHALEFASREGEAELEALTNVGRFLGLSAEMTLKEWRAGRLRFP